MENRLQKLFDYQRFEQNPHLARLIRETEARQGEELSDDALELVAAAGDFYEQTENSDPGTFPE